MASSMTNPVKAFARIALGLVMTVTGVYLAGVDDPIVTGAGPAVLGMLLMIVGLVVGARTVRKPLPAGTARTLLAAGVVIAAVAAFVIHGHAVAAPLFPQAADVPSVSAPASSSRWAAAVGRARAVVRAALVEQNLPGVSIAVGAGAGLVWAEGFGWRDVVTETPVTPDTRFNIGTAARAVTAAQVVSLGMTNTGSDPAGAWSPGHIGTPDDDFPPFTFVHDMILRPIGIAPPAQPLPGDRATFYAPRADDHDPRRGRRLMYMFDLACCAGRMAFYSTPSDLVRFALAMHAPSVTGALAGGSVVSLMSDRGDGIVVAVASNIAYANTAALAVSVADVFAAQKQPAVHVAPGS